MGTTQNIGNLNVTISGDATSLIGAFNQAMEKVDEAAARMEQKSFTMGAGVEGLALKVLAGARAFSMIHREIMNVIQNVDKIPGMPAEVISSIEDARTSMRHFRDEIDIVIGKMLAAGIHVGQAIGVGAANAVSAIEGLPQGDYTDTRSGREKANDAARNRNPNFDADVAKARAQLAIETHKVNEAEMDRIHTIEALMADSDALLKHSQSNSIDDLKAEQERIESAKKLAEAKKLVREIDAEIAKGNKETFRLMQESELAQTTKTQRLPEVEAQLKANKALMDSLEKGPHTPEMKDSLAEALKRQNELMKEGIPLLREQQKVWDEMGAKMSGTVQSMIVNGTSLRDTWHHLMKDIESDMVKTFLDGPLKTFFSNGLKSILGGFGGNSGGGFWSALASSFGGHAGGGNIAGPSIVGENGPELFVPSGSGSIITNDSMRAMGGGQGGAVYHIDARGADQAGLMRLESMIRALHGSIEPRAVAAVMQQNRRMAPS